MHAPPPENLVQLAEIFQTSVDYLLTGEAADDSPFATSSSSSASRPSAVRLRRPRCRHPPHLIDAMIVKHRVKSVLDGLIPKHQARRWGT